jgi:hypothetical protein
MPRRSGRSKSEPRHVRLYEYMERTEAWQRLSGTAVKAWLAIGLMYNGSNNGKIAVSCRVLGQRIGVGKNAAAHALLELENAGFVKCVKASSFSQKKLAAEYRLTHQRCDITGDPGTHDYRRPEVPIAIAAEICGCRPLDIREATERGEIVFRDIDDRRMYEKGSVLAYQRKQAEHPRPYRPSDETMKQDHSPCDGTHRPVQETT